MARCPACLTAFPTHDFAAVAAHFCREAEQSNVDHVRWLNQNVGGKKLDPTALTTKIREIFDLGSGSVKGWIKQRFIRKFYGPVPHPFVLALQRPRRAVLLGYVFEHQHFLRQWVRSCAHIIARTDQPDVVRYELDNLSTEYGGQGPEQVSHYELLLRMGESLGMDRRRVLETPPLPSTQRAIEEWDRIARQMHWVEAVAAMHSLELIANRNLVLEGASMRYFEPAILTDSAFTPATQAFLREGYEADVTHSDEALDLVERFSVENGTVEDVQATFLRSADLFDDYLIARLERGEGLES
jgi:pyrroloquinoline-quinone synthase